MHFIKTVVFLIAISFFIGVGSSLACGCGGTPEDPPKNDAERVRRILGKAEYVFVGKVAAFEYKKGILNSFLEDMRQSNPLLQYETKFVKFTVEHWWKGPLGAETSLKTDETRNSDGTASNSSCNYGFKEGETYIVFANMYDGYLTTNNCTATSPVGTIKDLDILGEGNLPVKFKN